MYTRILDSDMFLLLVLGVGFILSWIYLNAWNNEKYWKKRGAEFTTEGKYLGPLFDFMYSKKPLFEILQNVYKKHPNAPAVGLGTLFEPTLFVTDLSNIQHVLSADFNSFNHRGAELNPDDLLADNILFMKGKRWKLMRQHMTPLFTSAKLKSMYYIMDKSAEDFVDYLKKNPQYLQGNAFNTLSTFCSAAIGASVFGVGTESIFESPFLKMAQKANEPTTLRNFQFAIANASPTLSKLFGFKIFKKFENFFIGAIKNVIRAREKENVKRHDFADICVSLQSNGMLRDPDTGFELEPTDELLAAQAFFFFIAGVEPSATSMFSVLVELGRHPEVLQKVHEEIDRTFEKHSKVTHDVLSEMEYFDMAICEAMRLHPPIGFLTRMCVHDTVLPVGNIKVDKGTKVFTPIFDIHHDEQYYPDPEAFKPERFSKENRHTIKDAAYMPFGKGNRVCIGTRYAQLQVKAGLVHLLRSYTVKTILEGDLIEYSKQMVQVRMSNADVQFLPRSTECKVIKL